MKRQTRFTLGLESEEREPVLPMQHTIYSTLKNLSNKLAATSIKPESGISLYLYQPEFSKPPNPSNSSKPYALTPEEVEAEQMANWQKLADDVASDLVSDLASELEAADIAEEKIQAEWKEWNDEMTALYGGEE